ncbi:MAG: T9SS type A sorting domain-containing protein, partial [Flavobacteriaceae bacterium]|nr:T9SS type A sorting domain-containing protein [Flavobacteriaceae bacterium]
DVGQGEVEEINKVANTLAAVNYGWRCFEGSMPFNNDGSCPPVGDLTFPVAEYPHPTGFSITGGYVYRGSTYPDMVGLYFFADFVTGIIGTVDADNNLVNHGTFGGSWASFGVDMNQELYIVSISGSIFRVKDNNLGIETEPLSDVVLFPNPAEDYVTLNFTEGSLLRASIFNIKGQKLRSIPITNGQQYTFDTSTLASGLYFMVTESLLGTKSTKKFMIK